MNKNLQAMVSRFAGFRLMVSVFVTGLLFIWVAGAPAGEEPKPADAAAERVTYDDHLRPILREHCFTCHNQNDKRGGLAVDTYASLMEGGSSGEVVFDSDLDSSRLWTLVNHDETPYMPPNQDRIADAKLEILKKWIEGGSLENLGSKAPKKKATSLALAAPAAGVRPENPAMPVALWKQPVVFTQRPAGVTAIAASPWAPVAAVAGQKQIVLYNSDTGKRLGVMPFPEGEVHVLRFSRDGSVLLAGGGRGAHSGYVALYDVASGRRLVRVGDELDVVLAADISPDLSRVALGGPQRLIRIYATDTGDMLYEIKKHTDWVYAVEYSPDGVLLATSDRANGLFVWEADTARQWLDLRGHNQAVTDVSWRLDSNVLASSSMDGTVKLWEMNEGRNIKSWNAHGDGVMCVEYTHDGQMVTAGRDKTVKTWSTEGNAVRTFPVFVEMALQCAFTHDGKRVLGGDWNGEVRMWEAEDGNQVAMLPTNPPTLVMALEQARQQLSEVKASAEPVLARWTAAEQMVAEKTAAMAVAAEAMQASMALAAQAEEEMKSAAQSAEEMTASMKRAEDHLASQRAAHQQAVKSLDEADESTREQEVAELEKLVASLAAAEQALKEAQTAKEQADKVAAEKATLVQSAADKAAADKTAADKAAEQRAAAEQSLAEQQTATEQARQQLAEAEAGVQQAEQEVAAFAQAVEQLATAVDQTRQQAELAAKQAEQLADAQQAAAAVEAAQQAAEDAAAAYQWFQAAYGP